jgi:hypothetical protein
MTDYSTIICLNAWRWDRSGEATGDPSGQSQTYADPAHDIIDGWNVYLSHRDTETDDLVDPEGAPDFEGDWPDYETALAVACALSDVNNWEVREY